MVKLKEINLNMDSYIDTVNTVDFGIYMNIKKILGWKGRNGIAGVVIHYF